MGHEFQVIGLTVVEFRQMLKSVMLECLRENRLLHSPADQTMSLKQVRKMLGISPPTLRKYIAEGLIRRHNLGPRKKVFYLSELEEDIKNLPTNID